MTKVAVFGAGSWGTAFSLVLADAGQDVTIWARRPEVCDAINQRHENTEYFPGIELPPSVRATTANISAFADPGSTVEAKAPSSAVRKMVAPGSPARVATRLRSPDVNPFANEM